MKAEIPMNRGRAVDWRELAERSRVHSDQAEFSRAAETLHLAVELCDDSEALPELYARLGELLEEKGDLDAAIEMYEEALSRDQAQQDSHGAASSFRRLGSAYQEKGRFDQAEEAYRKAELLLKRSDDDLEKAKLLAQLGSLEEERGRYRKAEQLYRRALASNERLKSTLGAAVCHRHLGSVLLQSGSAGDALAHLNEALAALENLPSADKPELIDVYNLLGAVAQEQGHVEKALSNYSAACKVAESIDHQPGMVDSLRGLGTVNVSRGECGAAQQFFEQAIIISRQLEDNVALSDLYVELGALQAQQGDFDEAIRSYDMALSLDQEHRDERGMALVLRHLGSAYVEQGKFLQAEDAYRKAESLLKRGDDQLEFAELYIDLGVLKEEQQQYRQAREQYQRASRIFETHKNSVGHARCLTRLGSVLREIGQLSEAVTDLEQALKLFGSLGNEHKPDLILVHNALGSALEDQGLHETAINHYEQARYYAVEIDNHPGQADSWRHLGSAYLSSGDYANARRCYQEAVQISIGLDDEVALSEIYAHLGEVFQELGDFDAAISAYEEAFSLDQAHGDSRGMAGAWRRLGSAYQAKGRYDQAEDAYRKAESLLKRGDDEIERAILSARTGSLAEERGRYRKAEQFYRKALEINDRLSNAVGIANCQRHLGSALRQLGRVEEAVQCLEEALNLLEAQGGSAKPELARIYQLLGLAREEQGLVDEARTAYERSLKLAEALDYKLGVIESLRRIALMHAGTENYATALRQLQQAAEVATELHNNVALCEVQADTGLVLKSRAEEGDMALALSRLKQGLRIAQRLEKTPAEVRVLLLMANTFTRARRFEQAQESLDEAAERIEELDGADWRARLLLERGRLILADATSPSDRTALSRAAKCFTEALGHLAKQQDGALVVECREALLDVYLKQRDVDNAFDQLRSLTSRSAAPAGPSPWRHLLKDMHPDLRQVIPLFTSGDYQAAVERAYRSYEEALRHSLPYPKPKASVAEMVGVVLAQRESFAPWREEDELKAFRLFSENAYRAFRNPVAHHEFVLSAPEAFCLIGVVHVMLTWLSAPSESSMS